jgi:hypothetical protein
VVAVLDAAKTSPASSSPSPEATGPSWQRRSLSAGSSLYGISCSRLRFPTISLARCATLSPAAATTRGGWREDILPVALDDNRVWYRYDHLFADFLREDLEREGSEPLAPLRLRAYERCEDNGLVAEARWRAASASGRDRAADGK